MKVLREIVSWLVTLAAGIVIALFITLFVFQPTYVEGSSMEPTLQDDDKVIINKLPSTFHKEPEYGDIVVIDSRVYQSHTFEEDLSYNIKHNLVARLFIDSNDDYYWIKRVIAKAGDTLQFADGKILRNGEILEETYLKEPASYPNQIVEIPEDHVFVMGDNRNVSRDSREIGCVPLSHVLGKFQLKF